MKRQLFFAALSFVCAAAHGQSTTWTFTYTGFYEQEQQRFVPDAVLTGSFTGSDLNGNGVIELRELSSLVIPNLNYPLNVLACTDVYPVRFNCSTARFSYSAQAGLDFRSISSSYDENDGHGEINDITTGLSWNESTYSARFGSSDPHSYRWTDQTKLSVVSSVPEPTEAAMLGLGLGVGLLAAGLRQRRRRGV
jgi:hypothetical protein